MKVTPLDLRQTQFNTVMRGFDKMEVRMLLSDAADDYEAALREIDRLRQDVNRMEVALAEHREREANLRNTLLTAQKLADQIRENAETEARMKIREAEGRSELLLQKAQARLEEVGHEIAEMKLRRRDVESSLEACIGSLQNAVEFVRAQDRSEREDTATPRITRINAPLGPRPVVTPAPPAPSFEPVASAAAVATVAATATPAGNGAAQPAEHEEEEMLAQLRQLAHEEEQRAARFRDSGS